MLTFAKFAKAIRKAMSVSSDEELVNVLLGCIYEPFINDLISDKNKQEKFYIKKEYASRLMSGAYDVHLEIQAGSGDPTVIAGADEYFQKKVIDKYSKPSMVDDLLSTLKKIIGNDATISEAKKQDLFALASKETLAKFLASVCLYVVNKPNKDKGEVTPDNNLPEQNTFFAGRSEKLESIDRFFKKDKKGAVNICQTVSGLGGIGKTQLAIEYAYRYCGNYTNCIWFVVAESSTTVYNDFRGFAQHFNLTLPPEYKPEELQWAVKSWLAENSNWLLIFDNLESIDVVKSYLPQKNMGRIIITSRSMSVNYGTALELGVFDLDESLFFLRKRVSNDDELKMENYKYDDFDEYAPKLAERLGYLPLALEQAGAYIVEMDYRITDYLNLLGTSSVDAFKDKDAKALYYENIVSETWKISFEALSVSGKYIMNLCAYMAPDRIPVSFFVDMRHKLPSPLREDLGTELTKNRVFKDIRNYSLAQGDAYFFSIHRLVQEVTRKSHEVETDAI